MSSDTTLEIKPKEWLLPNRKGFNKWVYDTFKYDNTNAAKNYEKKDIIHLFPHQRLVRDYMQYDSPYRGILLYHGLGVGKTCASIAAAEGFLENHKKVIIMVPASLAINYKQEIMRCASIGNPSYKIWNYVEFDSENFNTDAFISKDFAKKRKYKVWLPYIPSDVKVIKKGVSWKALKPEEKDAVSDSLYNIIDNKYTFINYNGLTSKMVNEMDEKFFEESIVIMDEAHNFISRVVNGGKVATNLYKKMMQTQTMRLVLLSGTPVINHPFELSFLLNLLRGPLKTYESSFLKVATNIPTESAIKEKLGDLVKYIDHIKVYIDQRKVKWTFTPQNYVMTDNMTLQKEKWAKKEEDIQKDIQEILHKEFKLGKRISIEYSYALPNHKDEFENMFIDLTDPENPRVKNMDLFMRRIMGIVSYFRTAGEEYFPEVKFKKLEQVPFSNYQFQQYDKVRDEERKMELRQKQAGRIAPVGLFGNKGTVYRAFSRMACNFVFPENIKREFPKDIRKTLEKNLESILEHEIDAIEEEPEDKNVATKIKKDEKDKLAISRYENHLKEVMNELQQKSDTLLTPKALENLYSPKISRILDHINTSPGKNLLYSQFRSIEGLGVMRLVLLAAGYVEIKLEKKNDEWSIVDHEKVLHADYEKKRFIIFDNDREKIRILLNIYNGNASALPKKVRAQVGERKNLRGEVVSLLMITQSGAEGISLTNVRRVMIMEPFWNMVRIDQVIGRAVRTASHVELPLNERNVEVYIYVSVFTPLQLKQNFTLMRLDSGLTSDSHIMQLAQKKDEIIQTFLNHIKSAALDCITHAPKNKLMNNGIKCYSFPIPVIDTEESFIPNITEDLVYPSRMVRTRKIQGNVIRYKNKKYVTVNEYPDQFFDYESYKDAGVLVPVTIF